MALVEQVWTSHDLAAFPEPIPSAGIAVWLRPFAQTANYLTAVWKALVFGLCISAAVSAFLSPSKLLNLFGTGTARAQIAAGIAGMPLMLCSCCAAPVASAVYEQTRRTGAAFALLLAAPSLNPAALALTFLLFTPQIAAARLGMALVAVFISTAILARLVAGNEPALESEPVEAAETVLGAAERFMRALGRISVRTLPLVAGGVLLSTILMDQVPMTALSSSTSRFLAIAVAALIAVPVALPTFFEIPLGLTLMNAGAPAGLVAAVLFAGPAVNLPSLLTVGRATGWRVAAGLGVAVFVVALAGGYIAG